ncbi:MAG TPA: hypothetical protein PLU72_09530 [Candidatus Ozemobacteraceae bacterium]|nr:hypothetical protein [Candidatus Ozemobacteraceae bacterium]HQG29133.1 hypothetical protein [Candidatus Ozemobacteraceae bacterium]
MPTGSAPARSKKKSDYSAETLCRQLHALFDLLDRRRNEILADPAYNPDNDELVLEMDRIVRRIALIRECFEEFCPS